MPEKENAITPRKIAPEPFPRDGGAFCAAVWPGGKQIYAPDAERKHFGFSPVVGEAEGEESAGPQFLGVPAEQSVLRLFDESLARLGLFEFLWELRELFDHFKVSADSVGTL